MLVADAIQVGMVVKAYLEAAHGQVDDLCNHFG